jgi:hypothetical protein
MTLKFATVRRNFADQIATRLPGVGQVYAYPVETFAPPCGLVEIVMPMAVADTYGGGMFFDVDLTLVAGPVQADSAQRQLDDWMSGGPGGLWYATMVDSLWDSTLGGAVNRCQLWEYMASDILERPNDPARFLFLTARFKMQATRD